MLFLSAFAKERSVCTTFIVIGLQYIGGIFRGRMRIGGKIDFAEKTFVDCSLVLTTSAWP